MRLRLALVQHQRHSAPGLDYDSVSNEAQYPNPGKVEAACRRIADAIHWSVLRMGCNSDILSFICRQSGDCSWENKIVFYYPFPKSIDFRLLRLEDVQGEQISALASVVTGCSIHWQGKFLKG